ncbi:UNVERIFIED_CONTAM: hypothetical protein FKN15_068462 [Acipenser sinensis]
MIGGPQEACSIPEWKRGLVENQSTWSVIDRGQASDFIPVWNIIMDNHFKNFNDPMGLACILRECWREMVASQARGKGARVDHPKWWDDERIDDLVKNGKEWKSFYITDVTQLWAVKSLENLVKRKKSLTTSENYEEQESQIKVKCERLSSLMDEYMEEEQADDLWKAFEQKQPAGEQPPRKGVITKPSPGQLEVATDWKMLADVGQRLIFPPEIATTNLRPDIVLWSGSARLVHLLWAVKSLENLVKRKKSLTTSENYEEQESQIKVTCERLSSLMDEYMEEEQADDLWKAFGTELISDRPKKETGGQRTNKLELDDFLTMGQSIFSANGKYKAIFQNDGNFVVYEYHEGVPIWASDTWGKWDADKVIMQGDCNLVINDINGTALWQSNTHMPKCQACCLTMQDDGNLVIYRDNKEIWSCKNK